jgi:UPF0716 protein FxsA
VAVPLLILLFIVVPLVELYVIIQVGQAIGALPTIGLLLLDSVLGAMLLRAQGRAAWRRFNLALAERRVPARETFDGAMVIVGGTLLLTPGFVTDVVGVLLLLPPTRAAIRRLLSGIAKRRMAAGQAVFWTFGQYQGTPAGGPRRPASYPRGGPRASGPDRSYDVEGTGHEVADEPSGELPEPKAHGER